MTNKLPTIDIKGKEYVLVKDRIIAFNEQYPNGRITTELVSPLESKMIVMKATVVPDVSKPERYFSDYSQAVIGQGMVNTTAAMENASTSAVGRALAYMGIGVIDSIASADEVNKALTAEQKFEIQEKALDEDLHGEVPETRMCTIHNVMMTRKISKNGKPYLGHHDGNAKFGVCFGTPPKE